jgi:hypothetical protein
LCDDASRASPLSSVLPLFHSGDFALVSTPIMAFLPFRCLSTSSSCLMLISIFSVGEKYWLTTYISVSPSLICTHTQCVVHRPAILSAVMCIHLIPTAAIGGSCFEPRQAIAIFVPSPGTLPSMLYGSCIRRIALPSAFICALISWGTILDLCILCCRILIPR